MTEEILSAKRLAEIDALTKPDPRIECKWTQEVLDSHRALLELLKQAGVELECCQSPIGTLPARRTARHSLIEKIRNIFAEGQ